MKLLAIFTAMYLIQNTAAGRNNDDEKYCRSSKWLTQTVKEARADELECKVQNSRIFGICGLIMSDLFKFKKEIAFFTSDHTAAGRYNKYNHRQQKAIHQYMETKKEHLLRMHDYMRCADVREHMENYYPQLFLIHSYTLSDLSIKDNILPFVDFGLNKVVHDEENLDEKEQDALDMYVNVPINLHNRITDIFLSYKGDYAQYVRYRRSTNDEQSQIQAPVQEKAMAKMYEAIKHMSDVKNAVIGAAQNIEDMIQENEEKTAVDRDNLFQKIANKMDSNLRKQQYDTESLLDDINLPKFGSQTVLIIIISIQLIAILLLISMIAKKNSKQNQNQNC